MLDLVNKRQHIFYRNIALDGMRGRKYISAVLPQMKSQGYGRIVTLSGGGADRPIDNMTIYSASKGGVLAFSKCLAVELGRRRDDIKLNIFQPGKDLFTRDNLLL